MESLASTLLADLGLGSGIGKIGSSDSKWRPAWSVRPCIEGEVREHKRGGVGRRKGTEQQSP